MKNNSMKWWLCLLFALVWTLGMSDSAMAAVGTSEYIGPGAQSIILHKIVYEEAPEEGIQNNGIALTEEDLGTMEFYDPAIFGEVGFTVYMLKEPVEGYEEATPQAIADAVALSIEQGVPKYGAEVAVGRLLTDEEIANQLETGSLNIDYEHKVGADGLVRLSLSNRGDYVIIETTAPDNTALKAKPMFLSLPIRTSEGYHPDTIDLYPKNILKKPTQDLRKLVQRNGADTSPQSYKGAVFALYAGTPGEGSVVPGAEALSTNEEGNIPVTDLTPGSYYFVETQVAAADQAAEGADHNNVLIKPEFTNSAQNRLTFTCEDNATITYPEGSLLAEGQSVINYESPAIDKSIVADADHVFAVGDTITYQLTLTTPHDVNTYTQFVVKDTAPEGVSVDAKSLTVEGKTPDTDYTVAQEGAVTTLTFDPEKLSNGEEIVVTYQAKINDQAVIGKALENTAVLAFNNGYEGGTESDTETVQTYGHDLFKQSDGMFGSGIDREGLSGADFVIRNDKNQYLKVTEDARSWVESVEEATHFTTGEDGKIHLTGLDLGEYVAVEMKAPQGYELPEGEARETKFTVKAHEENAPETTTILNTKRPDMPMSGSEKVLVVGIGLTALLGVAVVLGNVSRKESLS